MNAVRDRGAVDRLARHLAEEVHLEGGLERFLDTVIEVLGADFGNVQLFEPATGKLTIRVQRGFTDDFLANFREVDALDASVCGRALRNGSAVIVEDVLYDSSLNTLVPIMLAAGVRAVQSTPIIGPAGEIMGIVSTHFRRPTRPAGADMALTAACARLASDFVTRFA